LLSRSHVGAHPVLDQCIAVRGKVSFDGLRGGFANPKKFLATGKGCVTQSSLPLDPTPPARGLTGIVAL
jgi:hypothetical protein